MIIPPLATIPTPGAYLDRRRVAAGLTRKAVAEKLAKLPYARVAATPADIVRLADRIAEAELEGKPFNKPQAALLRQAVPLDVDIYLALIDLEAAGPDCGLPVPQICTSCACSWHDACETKAGPCAWTASDPNLCTACVPAPAVVAAAEPELVR